MQLGTARQQIKSHIESIIYNAQDMTFYPEIYKKSDSLKQIKTHKDNLIELTHSDKIPPDMADKVRNPLVERLFMPLTQEVSDLVNRYNETLTNIQMAPNPTDYNTTNLHQALKSFYDEKYLKFSLKIFLIALNSLYQTWKSLNKKHLQR